MAAIRSYDQIRLRPGAVKRPGALHGANYIITPLDDNARNVTNLVNIAQKLIIRIEESVVNEVVDLDPGKGQGKFIFFVVSNELRLGNQL